ncbi:bifunctional phosphopantothenoylcysteine decarboxylase/phosphopantothenate--cysteine ligase CoaBC [Enhygromyxa salina]|uniref:Coenzyme A biosynthesis bifunctional protein CoaBC n=1 Tax=Enhygromyxa salina TaxID=215803 RepID=A0A2S9YPN3_9BACT|nr:bifunctional phosphopantothenoylcysteine decarboxylase/phosphopantothenate--cysteine ligase CoaBC [Enhygromyxa salina]PRQ07054.1 Coenzyme A biosynthesis bifunctional protein CoaBC [Enhygromyxa salina]
MTRVVLIVAGGIAAYKAPDLVRKLIAVGCEVQVVTTPAAAAFCTELSLATVSGRPVRQSLLDAAEEGRVGHIEIADWAQLVLVAPATADIMARAAAGMANDLATTILLATRAPVLWAPAMNTNMWSHAATQANLALLRERGAAFVGPDRGELACGWIGEGRMIDPPIIAAAARALVDRQPHPELVTPTRRSWVGRKLLVTAGPTRAFLDPVRFISNASTGEMGFGIAAAAAASGAEVVLVAGPVALPTPAGVRRVDVETGAQMLDACERELAGEDIDLVAMVAAVADLVPAEPSPGKLDKDRVLASLSDMRWRAEVDILATLAARHRPRTRFLGFAAQTVDTPPGADAGERLGAELRRLGRAKLERKGCDALFVNRVGVPGVGFGSPTNAGFMIFAEDAEAVDAGPPQPKLALAEWMLAQLEARWWPSGGGS